MAMTWTADQQRVIDSRDRNLLVSAAAGSGKTAVLVERIVKMVTDDRHPVDLDRLLVMTFTNAAAAQMRERIARALQERLKSTPEDARLRLQAALVPHAQIQTIDSFCLSLIRSHYAGLDIDPSFRVGDEGELTLLKGDVLAELLEERYEAGGEAFELFVETYGGDKTDSGIEEAIRQVYQACVSHPWPDRWLEGCRKEFDEENAEHFTDSPWAAFLLQEVKLKMRGYAEQLEQALKLCGEPDGPEVYLATIRTERELVIQIGEADGFAQLKERLSAAAFGRLPAARKKDIDPEKKEQVKAIRDRVKKGVLKCKESYAVQTMEEIRAGIAGCAPAVRQLIDLTGAFMERYQQAKKERDLVDFSDLEHYALQILYQDGAPSLVADQLSCRYVEILVDEYQDSNLVQEALIWALSGERFGRPDVFMVGDVKQSIYRFRQARPELFLEKYDTYGREEGPYQKIELQKNFRSRSQVLTSINQVFSQIMDSSLGKIRYTREAALYPGAFFPEVEEDSLFGGIGEPAEGSRKGADPYRTELFLVDTGSRELSSLDEEARDLTSREIEVKLAVREIFRLTDPEHGLLIWDKEEERYRRARYGDIVILLRSLSGWAEPFVNGLMDEGIPAFAQSQSGYFDTTEVETILSLLSVIDNPMQDIPLAAVMRSPIVGMSDEELAWMMARFKRRAKKGQDRGIYGAWRMWLEEGRPVGAAGADGTEEGGAKGNGAEKDDWEDMEDGGGRRIVPGIPGQQEIDRKLKRADALLTRFRYLAKILPIHQLLELLYRETGYYAYVSAMPAGETRQANLELLIEKAAAYESTSYQGVFHFIRYIEKLKKVDTDLGEAAVAGAKERTVKIMSIHKSKGLEFPIVILAGMGKRFNKQDAYGRLLIDPDLGVGADHIDLEQRVKSATLKKQVLKRKLELEGMGEELRVLYVAMTRAKEKLIMTGTDIHLENKLEKWGIDLLTGGEMVTFGGGQGHHTPAGAASAGAVPACTSSVRADSFPDPLSYTVLTGAGSYLDWILMALPRTAGTIACSQVPAASFIGREVLRQMEKQASKEMLLEQSKEKVWDEAYRESLREAMEYTYPHGADVGVYAMMSVSELKRRSQKEEYGGVMELVPQMEETACNTAADGEAGQAASDQRRDRSGAAGPLQSGPDQPIKEREQTERAGAETGKSRLRQGFGGAARGSAYHRALELLSMAECCSFKDVVCRLDGLVESGRFLRQERKLVDAHILWEFFKSPLGQRLKKAEQEGCLHKEQQFMIGIRAREMDLADSDELVLVQGVIDAYIEEADGTVLIDYKTDRVERAEELKKRYQVQLRYYIRALEQVTEKPVKEAVLYSLHLQQAIRVL